MTFRPLAHALLVLPVALASSCATLSPRFPLEVSTSFAREPMRKLETARVELYYPEPRQQAARQVLARLDGCLEALHALTASRTPREKVVAFMTSADFNNAYAYPRIAGNPPQMVLPTRMSLELFNLLELGVTAIGDVACHEAVHYVHMQQTDELWAVANLVLGDVMSPNIFTESWFVEGLATYYESRLGKAAGRPESPLWRGMFESGVAARGGALNGGDLNPVHREMVPFGAAYLVGSHFIEYLVRTHGEEKLWKLIDTQGRSIFSPLGVTLRFGSVYGRDIDGLMEDFSAELKQTLKPRARPAGQEVLAGDMGFFGRLASSTADGALALLVARRDEVPLLEVREADGSLRFARGVTPFLPGRPFVNAHPLSVSGLSFSRDGQSLFFVLADVAADGSTETKLVQLDARTGDLVRTWDGFTGMGGSISPDGQSYYLVEIADERSNLSRLDLRTGSRQQLTDFTGQESLGAPAISPDGQRVAFIRWMDRSFEVILREEDGTLRRLTRDEAFDYSPRWIDRDRLLVLHERDGRAQAHVLEVASGQLTPVTDAPYAALDPVVASGDRVAFLNREGWSWTLDTVPLPERPAGTSGAALASAPLEDPLPPLAEGPEILSDAPYTPLERFFIPTLRVPWVAPRAITVPGPATLVGALLGISLMGSDRLGLHGYALNASWDTLLRSPNVEVGYGTALLAPWWVQLSASYASGAAIHPTGGGAYEGALVTNTRLSASASRTLWTTPVTFSLDAIWEREAPTSVSPGSFLRFVGPQIGVEYLAAEGTAYGGTRRALGLAGFVAAYPMFLGSSVQLADLGGSLTLFVPLPFTTRHTLRLTGRGRILPGAPPGLLQVGGVGRGLGYTVRGAPDPEPPPLNLPSGVSFVEPMRGYEDFAVRGTMAAIGGARYRYPLIVDAGYASFFYLFPSFFIRQMDLEAFGEVAVLDNQARPFNAAAGAAVLIRTVFGSALPVSVIYQFSYRFDPALLPSHFVGIAFE
jgi:hypothetical protein